MTGTIHTPKDQILEFTLDGLSFALSLPVVKKVIHAIEIRHLPKAPEIIIGIININGRIIPVANIRKRFGLEPHEIDLNDRLIISDTGKREIAILVDSIIGISDIEPRQLSSAAESLPFAEHISSVAKFDDGLVLIYDLERFLSLEEDRVLENALKNKKS
jgi:purine-binding chemotaxis protein CheW